MEKDPLLTPAKSRQILPEVRQIILMHETSDPQASLPMKGSNNDPPNLLFIVMLALVKGDSPRKPLIILTFHTT